MGKVPAGSRWNDRSVVLLDNAASCAAIGLTIAFLTGVFNSVSTTSCAAVGSACVGGSVIVQSASVALFSNFNDSVSANRLGSSIQRSKCGLGANQRVSAVQRLNGSAAFGDHIGESCELVGGQQLGSWHHKPLNVFSARWVGLGSLITVSICSLRGNQLSQIDLSVGHGLSATI